MKYKEIVDIIKNTCLDNFFINEFSYGNISDINTPDDEEPVNYPYAFLNPINVTNDGITSTFNANLIIMTQTYDTLDEELEQQSNCINYLEQIIGKINKNLDNPQVEFLTPFSVTPFKERFSDNVVGATASIAIQYPSNITDCDTPYAGECDLYQTACYTNNWPPGWNNGRLTYYKNALLRSYGGNVYELDCDTDYAMYTGTTSGGNPIVMGAWDVNGDGSFLIWQMGEVTSGTIECGQRITFGSGYGVVQFGDATTINCLGVNYINATDEDDLVNGIC